MKNNLFLASIFSISLFMPLTGCATLQDGLDAVNSGLESANNTLSSVLGKSKATENNSDAVVVNKSKNNKVNVDDLPSDYTIDLTKNPNKLAAIPVDELPANGSSIVSPAFVDAIIERYKRRKGFCVG